MSLPLEPAHSKNISPDARQYAYRIIKKQILEFSFIPGQKLNEIDLSKFLNVSRTPVHDTLNKLSRENLVDIISQRGAFVSYIDIFRIKQAAWTHSQLGSAMLQTIIIRQRSHADLGFLKYTLKQLEDLLSLGDDTQTVRLITEFHHQLYIISGKMEYIWSAVQNTDGDLRRLLYLATRNSSVALGLLNELQALYNALAQKNLSLACEIYSSHFDRILMLIPVMQELYPSYFEGNT